MGGGQWTLMTSSFRPWASVVFSRISRLRALISCCRQDQWHDLGEEGKQNLLRVSKLSVLDLVTQNGTLP